MTRLNLLQGTLDLLALKVLEGGPLHGYAISQRIQELSDSRLQVEEGSLYPALYRMEKRGWIGSQWGKTALGRRARFYSLTAAGLEQLGHERENWEEMSGVINRIMREA